MTTLGKGSVRSVLCSSDLAFRHIARFDEHFSSRHDLVGTLVVVRGFQDLSEFRLRHDSGAEGWRPILLRTYWPRLLVTSWIHIRVLELRQQLALLALSVSY